MTSLLMGVVEIMTWYDKGGGGVKIPGKTSDVINECPLIDLRRGISTSAFNNISSLADAKIANIVCREIV